MKLLTKTIEKSLPAMRSQESKPANEVRIRAKFFNPIGAGTWYATEYDPDERLFFGFVTLGDPQNAELGYFSLDELASVQLRFGLGIERDIHWDDTTTLQTVMDRGW